MIKFLLNLVPGLGAFAPALPWILLGGMVWSVGLFGVGYWRGIEAERGVRDSALLAAETKLHQRERELQEQQQAAVIGLQKRITGLEVEKNATDAKLNGTRLANGRLVVALGGLYDKNGKSVDRGAEGNAAGNSSDLASGPAGCKLSMSVSDDLLDLMRDADGAASYANSCKKQYLELHTTCRQLLSLR